MLESEKSSNPLISVIIPVYNVKKYLNKCLESVTHQTYENLEIIVVDDGSTDGSGELCDIWHNSDPRIVLVHKENGGLSSARNAGIDISHGEYVCFVDSDDWVSSEYVYYLYHLMKSSGADLAMADFRNVVSYDEDVFSSDAIEEKIIDGREFIYKVLKVGTQENVQYAWGKIYKNFRASEIRFPEGLIDEDVPTTFSYALTCRKVAISSKVVYAYYQNPTSILRKEFDRKRFDLLEVWRIIRDTANTKCDSEIARYATVGYYRANFGILCNICLEKLNEMDMEYIQEQERIALDVVKGHWRELLSFPMPISRKIGVVGFVISYPACKRLLGIVGRINGT